MLHNERLLVAFEHLFHIVHELGDLLQVSFLVIFLVEPIAQAMAVIAFGMHGPIVIECLPIAVFFTFTIVTVQSFSRHHETFTIVDDFTE